MASADRPTPGARLHRSPPVVPFAVRPGPTVRSDLFPLDRPPPAPIEDAGPRTRLRIDAELPVLLANKLARTREAAHRWVAVAPDLSPAWLTAAGHRLAASVSAAVPDLVRVADGVVQLPGPGLGVTGIGAVVPVPADPSTPGGLDPEEVADRLAAVPPARRALEAVALAVGEDLVLIGRDGRARWVHVCAPSGWDPGAAGGAPLASLHGPIPTGERLVRASANLAAAITSGGPFVRWTWGLTPDDRLAQHADDVPAALPQDPGAWTFRAERQTTWSLPGLDAAVFAIRVHRAPLRQVVESGDGAGEAAHGGDRARRLAAAIRELPADLASYKGVSDRQDDLLRWLDRVAGSVAGGPPVGGTVPPGATSGS